MNEKREKKWESAGSPTHEHEDGSKPLQGCYDVPKQQHGAQDGEKLSCCGDDGAGEGPEIHNSHKDEGLKEDGEGTVTKTIY